MLVYQVLGGNPESNLEVVWDEIVDYYTENRVATQFTNLELGMFYHPGKYPKLSGKGAECQATAGQYAQFAKRFHGVSPGLT